MKRGLLTRGLAIGMICSMAFSCACGKKNNNGNTDTVVPAAKIDRDHVYRMEDFVLPVDGDCYVSGCSSTKDGLYVMANISSGDDSIKKLFKISYDDQEVNEISLDAKAWYECMECDGEGNIYLIKSGYDPEVVDDEEMELYEDAGSAEAADDYTLIKLSPAGEKLWEVSLTEEDQKNYVQSMKYVDGKGILTNCNGEFSLYDENTGEGKSLFTRHDAGNEDYYYATLYRTLSGDVYMNEDSYGDTGRAKLIKFNKDKLEFDEEIELPDEVYGGDSIYPGNAYDFYVNTNSEISAFNLGDDKTQLLCDFTASDILVDYVSFVSDNPEGQIMIVMNQDEGANVMAFLSKVDPNEVSEKETLTIGTIFIPNTIRQQVVKFNRKSDKYRINIIDYSADQAEDTGDAYMDAANKIGLDLTQGKGPDMLVIDYNMPVESYAEKGALEPLDPYFEADQEVNVTDYLENVIEATKVENKIFTIIPSFNIETCVAAKDKVGDGKVTLENYKDICTKNGIDPKIGMGTMSKGSAGMLYSTVGTQFVDYENGTCSFDSPGFIDLLKFINELPSDEDAEAIDYEEAETYYRNNKSLLMTYYVNSFEDYQVLKNGYFGKDIVFNGFPTAGDGVSYIRPYVQIAMNSDCKHKDVAWEFMKSFITDEFQKDIEWSIPIKQTAIDALAEKAQEKPYYIDSFGKKVETESVWTVGGTDVTIGELSKEETTEFLDFVKSVTATALYEEKIINIITEEADAFYEGQKSAEEVADIIQSRVSIYMSENM